MPDKSINLVIATGISGAGKTVAVQSFEGLDYFTIDNVSPALVPKFIELVEQSSDDGRMAFVVDMRSRLFFNEINSVFDKIDANPKAGFKILFLGTADDELVACCKETRRGHPLAVDGRILDGTKPERELLAPLKSLNQNVVDTTELTLYQLCKTISEQLSSEENQASSRIEATSLGFKHGLPLDADLVFDVRPLPNPCYKSEFYDQIGLEREVHNHAINHEESEDFYRHLIGLIKPILPGCQKEGKSVLITIISCTGGQHRSVAFVHRLTEELKEDWAVNEIHRDKNRHKETVSRS